MSTETANYNIIVDVQNQEAIESLNRVEAALKGVGQEAKSTADSVDNLDNQTNQLASSNRNLEGNSRNLNSTLKKLAAGFLTLEAAKKAVELVSRALTSAFETYSEASGQNQAQADRLTEAMDRLKGSFAQATFGGGNFESVIRSLENSLDSLGSTADRVAPAIRTVTSFLADVAETGSLIFESVTTGQNFVEELEERWAYERFLAGEATEQEEQFFRRREELRNQQIANDEQRQQRQRSLLEEFAAQQASVNRLLGMGGGTASQAEEASTRLQSTSSSLSDLTDKAVSAEQAIKALNAGLISIQGIDLSERNRQLEEGFQAALEQARVEEEQRLQFIQEAADRELAIQIALQEKIKEQNELAAEQAAMAWEQKINRISNIAGEVGSLAGNLMGQGFESAFAGKDFGKVALKLFGDYLASKGQAMLTEGAVDVAVGAFGNPVQAARGAAELAGGAALIGAGKAIGGAAKGGGGKRAAAVPTATTQPVQNTVINQVSFGFVGDRRAAARDVATVTEQSLRLGYSN